MDYGGGGHRTRLRTMSVVLLGCPLPPYIKEQGGGRPALGRAKEGSNPPPSGEGERGKGEEEEKERGEPPSLVQFGLPIGRGRGCPLWAASPLPYGPCRPNSPPRGSDNPRHSDNYPVTPGTHPVSEYSRPIYQFLCPNHFKTPRHVRNHIRDSELSLVHQNT